MSEVHVTCSHSIDEPYRLHPVDCDNCIRGATCKMRSWMQGNPGKIKSCRFFAPIGQKTL